MDDNDNDNDAMPSPQILLKALRTFTSSPHSFQILRTFPPHPPHPPKTLYILDSSFNPPTLAHLRICTTALLKDRNARTAGPKRLLLLLATQNADKAPKPAGFEQRLCMMCLFARDVLRQVGSQVGREQHGMTVDIGVTKLPMFVDKVREIESSGVYGKGKDVEQVHLVGYDTLIRLLDAKYYPPDHTLGSLGALFGRHRVRVTRRDDDQWGGKKEQNAYVQTLADGGREGEGGKREWAERIELVEGRQEDEEVVSSTKVRDAVKRGDRHVLGKLLSLNVTNWIFDRRLYEEDG